MAAFNESAFANPACFKFRAFSAFIISCANSLETVSIF